MMRIIHVGHDSQFMSFAAAAFEEVAPGASEHVVLTRSRSGLVKFPIASGRVKVVSAGIAGAMHALAHIGNCDMIVAHSLTLHAALAFARVPAGTVRVWSGWGSDYYGDDESPNSGLLGPSTLQLSKHLGNAVTRGVGGVKGRLRTHVRRYAASHTDLFSAPIPDDLEVFRARFPQFRGAYQQLNYASVEHTFMSGAPVLSGANILVGNSASLANNHLEVFDLLADLDLSGRKIVVPLSYGNTEYRRAIIRAGQRTLGAAFMPLVEYLPISEYVEKISNCGVVIMNHRRQQALGNIGAALYHGAHLYLDPANPTMNFFRSRGAVVRSIEDIAREKLPSGPVSSSEMQNNRDVLNSFWGSAAIRNNIEELLHRVPQQRTRGG